MARLWPNDGEEYIGLVPGRERDWCCWRNSWRCRLVSVTISGRPPAPTFSCSDTFYPWRLLCAFCRREKLHQVPKHILQKLSTHLEQDLRSESGESHERRRGCGWA
ncbi:unnamed protein product [Ectocarpus sp. 13 AM-2016]